MIGINNEVEMRSNKRQDMDILSCSNALRYETYRSYHGGKHYLYNNEFYIFQHNFIHAKPACDAKFQDSLAL